MSYKVNRVGDHWSWDFVYEVTWYSVKTGGTKKKYFAFRNDALNFKIWAKKQPLLNTKKIIISKMFKGDVNWKYNKLN